MIESNPDTTFTVSITIGRVVHVHQLASITDVDIWAEYAKRGGCLDATAFSSLERIDRRAKWGGRAARVEAQRYKLALLWLYGKSCLRYTIDSAVVDQPERIASPVMRIVVMSQYLQEIVKVQAQMGIYLGDGLSGEAAQA